MTRPHRVATYPAQRLTGTCPQPAPIAPCPGEQCDDNSPCCVQSTCQFAANATCSSSSSEAGCCTNCQTTTTATNCTTSDFTLGYCVNGRCAKSACDQYSDMDVTYCGMLADNPCHIKVRCCCCCCEIRLNVFALLFASASFRSTVPLCYVAGFFRTRESRIGV